MTTAPRIDRLEGLTEQMAQRLHNIENRLTSLGSRMANMWVATMGTMIAGFITMFVAILLTR